MKIKTNFLLLVFAFCVFFVSAQKQRSVGTFAGVSKNNAIENPLLSFGAFYQLTYNKLTYGFQYTRSNTLNTGLTIIDVTDTEKKYKNINGSINNFALYLGTKLAGNDYWALNLKGGSSFNLGSQNYEITTKSTNFLNQDPYFDQEGNQRTAYGSFIKSRNSLDFMGLFVGLNYHQALIHGFSLNIDFEYHQFFEKYISDGEGVALFHSFLPTAGISYDF